ncbi:hypothetical protein BS17DRAFT_751805 [Gyrodon lividus]|nr:hypothetical protein BS17DRAFT_751805 [Gyrodon lividus]
MEVDTTDTRCGRDERVRKALQILRLGRISLLDCILDILDPSKTHLAVYRRLFFVDPSGKFTKMLDRIFENDRGRAHLLRWMEPHAIELVSDKITSEMDNVKSALTGTISSITPESLLAWDVNMFIGTLVEEAAPITGHMLNTAAQTERAKQQNKIKSCSTACNVIVTQLAKENVHNLVSISPHRSHCLWTNGASRQTIEVLHKCGLCISFTSLTKLLNNLATQTLERAAHVACGPHMCYDNINISTSFFVEQRASAPAKVQSGTFAVLYEVRNGNPAYMHDVYINQLKVTHELLADRAIPSINDQSTNTRIRGAKALRKRDVNTFTRLQNLQLGFGLFHLCMNLMWALLHIHQHSIHQIGSLSFFALLDRTRLGCEHPDYHTLLGMLLQILQGIILDAWRIECGHLSLAAFASSNPSPDELLRVADQIILNYVTVAPEPSEKKFTDTSGAEPTSNMDSDDAHRNLRVLTCDLLHVLELVHATSKGDFGRIEDILGNLSMIFRGAGSNNYCSKILHFLHNLKKVWTPEFADIMRDNMLANLTGIEGHCMPIDLNIEHLIKFLKLFFAAKGVYASWDRLGDISATVDLLQSVRKQVGHALGIAYHGISHTTPDMQQLSTKWHTKLASLTFMSSSPTDLKMIL